MSIRTVNPEGKKVALLNRPSLFPSPSNSFSYSLSSFCVIAKKKMCAKSDIEKALASFQSSILKVFHSTGKIPPGR